ncbi:MAG: copper uptake system-associated protein [Hyphomicrobiales bacterium]
MMNITRRTVLAASLVLGLRPNVALAHDDQHEIIHLMKGMFDTPENPLSVEPVIVVGDSAIAGWVQGERGGRALLWRVHGRWKIRLCSCDGLKDPKLLESANISAADAATLASQLAAAEAKLDPAVLAKFSSFEGTMMIDPEAGHQGHKHGSATTP